MPSHKGQQSAHNDRTFKYKRQFSRTTSRINRWRGKKSNF